MRRAVRSGTVGPAIALAIMTAQVCSLPVMRPLRTDIAVAAFDIRLGEMHEPVARVLMLGHDADDLLLLLQWIGG
jgi:hypothetical protein